MIKRKRQLVVSHEQSDKRVRSSGSVSTHAVDPVSEALARLKALFPVKDFLNQLPPILWKQQIYACCLQLSRTEVDRKLVSFDHIKMINHNLLMSL